MRHHCRPDFSSRVLGMKSQNTDNNNTLHRGEPVRGRPGVSPNYGRRRAKTCCGFLALEFGSQRRHVKLSAWGCRCRQWSRGFKSRGIKLAAWGSLGRFWMLDFGLGFRIFGWLVVEVVGCVLKRESSLGDCRRCAEASPWA